MPNSQISKIPSTCRTCGNRLSILDMEYYLDLCESVGKHPLDDVTPEGVNCRRCGLWAFNEMLEEKDPAAKKLLTRLRMDVRGMKVVK